MTDNYRQIRDRAVSETPRLANMTQIGFLDFGNTIPERTAATWLHSSNVCGATGDNHQSKIEFSKSKLVLPSALLPSAPASLHCAVEGSKRSTLGSHCMRQDNLGSTQRTAQRSSRSTRTFRAIGRVGFNRRGAIGWLRCAYFSQAGDSAARYGISFERIVQHLWDARHSNRRFTIGDVGHMDDLLHAVACVDDIPLAWVDLSERYERALVRKCRGSFDEVQSTVFVRRVLADLRRRSAVLSHDERLPSLHTYLGTRPLRLWLADRMIGAKSWAGLLESCLRRSPRSKPLRLACAGAVHEVSITGIDDDPFPLMPSRSAGGSLPA